MLSDKLCEIEQSFEDHIRRESDDFMAKVFEAEITGRVQIVIDQELAYLTSFHTDSDGDWHIILQDDDSGCWLRQYSYLSGQDVVRIVGAAEKMIQNQKISDL